MAISFKKIFIAAAATLVAGGAMASDGNISITGSVKASTCVINGGNKNLDIPLPPVGTNTLAAAGNTAGRTPFAFNLTGCATGVGAPTQVSVQFEPGPNVNLQSGRLTPIGAGTSGVASNVEIGFLNNNFEAMKIGAISAQQKSTVATIDGTGNATLQYSAEYVATGASTAGSANSAVTYSLTYP